MPYTIANGMNIYYEVHGEGFPVVLIGGLGSQIESWATQVPVYSKHFKVVVFDNRGAGRSQKPEPGYTTEDLADDAAALMDVLGIETAHIVGKSMGGMIGQWLAIKHPEKVRKLVLGCSIGFERRSRERDTQDGEEIASKVGMKRRLDNGLTWAEDYIEEPRLGSAAPSTPSREPGCAQGYIGQAMR
jgi:pimeloyl-ACP methyl ester carboxylesterase